MSEKVKINIIDISEVDEEYIDTAEDVKESIKIEVEDISDDESNQKSDDIHEEEINYEYSRHERITPIWDKVSKIIDDNRQEFKDNLSEFKSRGHEKKDSLKKVHPRNFERYERIAELPRNIVEEVFLSGDSFYNRIKYEKHKDEGREIKVDKKE